MALTALLIRGAACAFIGGLLFVWGVAQVIVWSIAVAMFSAAGDTRTGGYLVTGVLLAGIGMALLFAAGRVPPGHGH